MHYPETKRCPPAPSPISGGVGGAARAPRGRLPDPVPGAVYGRWTVIDLAPADHSRTRQVHVRCVCGFMRDVKWSSLVRGRTLGCISVACRHAHDPNAKARRKPIAPRVPVRTVAPCGEPLPRRVPALASVEVTPGPALALIYPLDLRLPCREIPMRVVVLTGRVRARIVTRDRCDGSIQRTVEVLVEGEAEPRRIAVETLDPQVLADHAAEQGRAAAVEVWA